MKFVCVGKKIARTGMAYTNTLARFQTSDPLAATRSGGRAGRGEPRHDGSWAGPLASVKLPVARGSSRSSSVILGEVIRHVAPSLLKV